MTTVTYQPTDQPTTCPICGTRTDFVDFSELIQSHICLSEKCRFEFKLEFDAEYKDEIAEIG